MTKVYSLSREQVQVICPSCAEKMKLARIKTLKLKADAHGSLSPEDETTIKLFQGFSKGLCDKFGEDEGFFTRCADAMGGKVDDENAFCASLHKFCIGTWPAEKKEASLERGITKLLNAYPAEAVQQPLHRMFDEIREEREAQEAVSRLVWSGYIERAAVF